VFSAPKNLFCVFARVLFKNGRQGNEGEWPQKTQKTLKRRRFRTQLGTVQLEGGVISLHGSKFKISKIGVQNFSVLFLRGRHFRFRAELVSSQFFQRMYIIRLISELSTLGKRSWRIKPPVPPWSTDWKAVKRQARKPPNICALPAGPAVFKARRLRMSHRRDFLAPQRERKSFRTMLDAANVQPFHVSNPPPVQWIKEPSPSKRPQAPGLSDYLFSRFANPFVSSKPHRPRFVALMRIRRKLQPGKQL
jgi:hypothetical protein